MHLTCCTFPHDWEQWELGKATSCTRQKLEIEALYNIQLSTHIITNLVYYEALLCRQLKDQRKSVHCHIIWAVTAKRISHTCWSTRLAIATHSSLFNRGQFESIGPPKQCTKSLCTHLLSFSKLTYSCFCLFPDNNLHRKHLGHGEEGTVE